MSKKYIIIGSSFILIFIVLTLGICISKKNSNLNSDKSINTEEKETGNLKEKKDVEPISKENALKVLKATYGDVVTNTEEDLKQVGDEYVVDVRVCIEDKEGDSSQGHIHEQSIGTHKINIYTGELKGPK